MQKKNCWTDRDAVWGLTLVGPRNRLLDGVKIGQIHSQSRGTTSRRCGRLPNYFEHLSFFVVYCECSVRWCRVWRCRLPQQIYPTAAYFTPSAGVASTVAYQLPAGPAAPAATGPYSPRAMATSPAAAAAAAASPFFDVAVPAYPTAAGLTTIPGTSIGYDTAAAYGAGTFGAIPAAAATGPTAGGYLIAAGGHDGLTGAQFATGAAPPSALTQYALHYQWPFSVHSQTRQKSGPILRPFVYMPISARLSLEVSLARTKVSSDRR